MKHLFYTKIFVRGLLNKITNETWGAAHPYTPEQFKYNRCFNQEYLRNIISKQSEEMAFDLFVTDFINLGETWQKNTTGKTYKEWCEYERGARKVA